MFALKGNIYKHQKELLLKRGSAFKIKKVTTQLDPNSDLEAKAYIHHVEAEYVKGR